MAAWNDPIDLYCERLDASFWAEPVNALTNAAFLIAGLFALRLWAERAASDRIIPLLAMLVLAMAAGSFVFHTVATRWALFAEGAPIALFVLAYALLALRRFLRLGAPAAITLVAILAVASGAILVWRPRALNGSLPYVPALVALVAVGFAMRWRTARLLLSGKREEGLRDLTAAGLVTAAATILALALVVHTADLDLCGRLRLGTHWLWHLLNAIVLYLLLRAAILHRAGAPGQRP